MDELKHNEAFHANPLGEEPYTLPSQRPRKQMPEGVVSYPTKAGWAQRGIGFLVDQLCARPWRRAALGSSEPQRRFEPSVLAERIKANSKDSIARMMVYADCGN